MATAEEQQQQQQAQQQAATQSTQRGIFDQLGEALRFLSGFIGPLMFALVGGAVIMAIFPQAREWLGGLINNLPDNMKLMIQGFASKLGLSLFPDLNPDNLPANSDADPSKTSIRSLLMTQDFGKDNPGLVNALTADDATWKEVTGALQEANGGQKVDLTGLDPSKIITPQVLSVFLTKHPQLMMKMVGAMQMPAPGQQPSGATLQFLQSMAALMQDRPSFNAIFSGPGGDVVIALMAKGSPLQLDPAALKQFLSIVGTTNGAPNDQLYQFMNASFQGDQHAFSKLLTDPQTLAHPEALAVLGKGMGDPNMAPVSDMLQHNAAPITQLLKDLGPDKAQAAVDGMMSGGAVAYNNQQYPLVQFLLLPENQGAFSKFIDPKNGLDLNHMPPDMAQGIAQLRSMPAAQLAMTEQMAAANVNMAVFQQAFMGPDGNFDPMAAATSMFDPRGRKAIEAEIDKIKALGSNPQDGVNKADAFLRQSPLHISFANTSLALGVFSKLDGVNENTDTVPDSKRTLRVLGTFMGIATGTPHSMDNLVTLMQSGELTSFLAVPQNNAWMQNFFQHLDISSMPESAQPLLLAMKQHGGGILHALSDKAETQILIKDLTTGQLDKAEAVATKGFMKDAPDLQALQAALDQMAKMQAAAADHAQAKQPAKTPNARQAAPGTAQQTGK